MKLPFDRERMRERNLLDDIGRIEMVSRQTPEERFATVLAISDFGVALRRASPFPRDREQEIAEKARSLATPHRLFRT